MYIIIREIYNKEGKLDKYDPIIISTVKKPCLEVAEKIATDIANDIYPVREWFKEQDKPLILTKRPNSFKLTSSFNKKKAVRYLVKELPGNAFENSHFIDDYLRDQYER